MVKIAQKYNVKFEYLENELLFESDLYLIKLNHVLDQVIDVFMIT